MRKDRKLRGWGQKPLSGERGASFKSDVFPKKNSNGCMTVIRAIKKIFWTG